MSKLNDLFNAINYDADTMPEISQEIGESGNFLLEDVTEENLANLKTANNLPADMEQGNVEAWLDKQV